MTKQPNILKIYPTSRAIREINNSHKYQNDFLPNMMRIDEFEARCIIYKETINVDRYERIFLLREIISDAKFSKLKYNIDIIHFFTQGDAIFKFFEELASEGVDFKDLKFSDTYGEFEEYIEILQKLFLDYKTLLESRGLSDRSLLLRNYEINHGFVSNFDIIEVFIEGYLSNFEFKLMSEISKITNLILHFQTSKFTNKMQDRFKSFGLELDDDFDYKIDFTNKEILTKNKIIQKADIKVIATKERFEQIAIAFIEIQKMVDDGIAPDKIAVIVPDESIKNALRLFDRQNNLNFAMGFDYTEHRAYKVLKALEEFWKTSDIKDYQRAFLFGLSPDADIDFDRLISCKDFFVFLDKLKLLDCEVDENYQAATGYNEKVQQKYFDISMIFNEYILSYKEWLHLWLSVLAEITIDDTRGGKITVIGALETRSVAFDGVVVIDFNEDIIPSIPSKDNFLNTKVREFAGLPTKKDREALQKQLYKRVIERSKRSVIIYATSEEKLPSKFLYELGLQKPSLQIPASSMFYQKDFSLFKQDDIEVEFDPFALRWSKSSLKTFLECKKKYYYRYIKNIKQKSSEEENEGSLLHRIFEKVFKDKAFFQSHEELFKKISEVLEETLANTPFGMYQKLLYSKMLQGFIEKQILHFKAGWKIIGVEKEIIGEISGLKFGGIADRIDQDGTGTLIIDYKTGKSNKENSKNIETLKDFQANIYKELLGQKYKNVQFKFVKVFDGGVFEEVKNFEEKDKLFFEIIDELKRTKSFVNSKCEDLKTCEYCEFALMCQRGDYL
jgi:RecB family exonuclease